MRSSYWSNGVQQYGASETDSLLSDRGHKIPKRSIWSRLIFGWFEPLLILGNEQRYLDQKDLETVPLPEDCRTANVLQRFDRFWQHELIHETKPSLARALFRSYRKDFMVAGVLKLLHDICVFVGPQVLHGIITFLRDPSQDFSYGLSLVALVTLSQLCMSLCLRHYFFKCYATGLRIRTAVVASVYKKSLNLSCGERQRRTLGQITNLTSVDAQRLQNLTTYLHAIWYCPLQIFLALMFLWRELGPSSLGGVASILVMIPVTGKVASWMAGMQKKLMEARDHRTEINCEVIGGIRSIKYQAWEEAFQEKIMGLRETELGRLVNYFAGETLAVLIWTCTPLLVALSTFAAYVFSGHELNVAEALTSLALFEILRFPLFMLPTVINNMVEAKVSIKRVESFLLAKEFKSIDQGNLKDVGIKMSNVYGYYDSKVFPKISHDNLENDMEENSRRISLLEAQLDDANKLIDSFQRGTIPPDPGISGSNDLLCLKRVSIDVNPGEFICLVGPVGSGKSSIVNALLGEVNLTSGSLFVNGSLAYFSQKPFVMNDTIRNNVLFSHVKDPFNEKLYSAALRSTALTHDLRMFRDGDNEFVGERGITLSGGQIARLALARAIYHRADITVLDDPLSAVDFNVSKHLFEHAILQQLLDSDRRCVILVTNAIHHLNHDRVDRILVVHDGRIVESGHYKDLMSNDNSILKKYVLLGKSEFEREVGLGPQEPDGKIAEKEQIFHETTGNFQRPADEAKISGEIDRKIYFSWAKAAGGSFSVPIVLFIGCSVCEIMTFASNYFLTVWSRGESSQMYFLGTYAVLNLGAAVANAARMLIIVFYCVRASRVMYTRLLERILRVPMSFFDTTPLGRITNRFSQDINRLDEDLMDSLSEYLRVIFRVFSTVCVILAILPVFLFVLVPLVWYYLSQQYWFTLTYRELKRCDSVNRSPINALLGETIEGIPVIRAFGAGRILYQKLVSMIDDQQLAYFLTCTAQSWLAIRLELVGTLIITFASLIPVLERYFYGPDEVFAGIAGLAISYSLSVTQALNWSVRKASDLEASFVAVERIEEYSQLSEEGVRVAKDDSRLEEQWPSRGEIVFSNVSVSYRPGLPAILKEFSLTIPGGYKVGVCGRTGAGKSTLMATLMRLVEITSGRITIDGVNTRNIGIRLLRDRISVIPQDPLLYSGDIRNALDPCKRYDDETILMVLQKVELYSPSIDSSDHSIKSRWCVKSLSDQVLEGGSNFSVGQRQLLAIARSLLEKRKIVILDEATASIDPETDRFIQGILRREFVGSTCITIAHRLDSIMDSDMILVMSDGRVAEFDTPKNLLELKGLFWELRKHSTDPK